MTARRNRKSDDRLLTPDGHEVRNQITIDHMVAPLDRITEAMDRKWGIGRLPAMVPTEPPAHIPEAQADAFRGIVRRYGEAVEALNVAIAANDPDAVAAAVDRVSKGLRVMDRQCELAGVQPPEPEVWEFDLDGRAIAIVHDTADWKRAEASHPGRELFTLREAAVALVREKLGTAMLGEVVRLFPGAEPAPPTRKPNPQPEDDLPF